MRSLLALVLLAGLSACKADAQKCEQASRNFATLTFWKKADAEIAKAPPEKREALRRKKLSLFTAELEAKIDLVVSQCQSANNEDQIDCMIAAKTAEAALECAELVPNE
jgi:hypothetical protein